MELTPTINGKVQTARPAEFSLLLADRDAVRVLWPTLILPGLKVLKRKDPDSGFWQPEHVRQSIEAGLAGRMFCECHIVVPKSEGRAVGFMVLKAYPDEFIQVPVALFVWIAYCTSWQATDYLLKHEVLDKRAREMGFRYVDGLSSRIKPWGRRLGKHGYREHQVLFRKDVV